jgi:hypothetical protein
MPSDAASEKSPTWNKIVQIHRFLEAFFRELRDRKDNVSIPGKTRIKKIDKRTI